MDKKSPGHCEEAEGQRGGTWDSDLLHRSWARLGLLFWRPERLRDLPGSHSIWGPTRSDPYLLECSGSWQHLPEGRLLSVPSICPLSCSCALCLMEAIGGLLCSPSHDWPGQGPGLACSWNLVF